MTIPNQHDSAQKWYLIIYFHLRLCATFIMISNPSPENAKPICSICKKQFCNLGNLNLHMKGVHLRMRNYACEICGKAFKSNWYLTTHLRIHTGEKPFHCTKCTSSFADRSHFAQHVKHKHEEENVNHFTNSYSSKVCTLLLIKPHHGDN